MECKEINTSKQDLQDNTEVDGGIYRKLNTFPYIYIYEKDQYRYAKKNFTNFFLHDGLVSDEDVKKVSR